MCDAWLPPARNDPARDEPARDRPPSDRPVRGGPAHDEPVTVQLPAEIDLASSPGAGIDLAAVLWAGTPVVIADLTGTTFCDATGAAMLAGAHREAAACDAELLIAASPAVRRILALTRLDEELAVYPTLAAARTAALRPGSKGGNA